MKRLTKTLRTVIQTVPVERLAAASGGAENAPRPVHGAPSPSSAVGEQTEFFTIVFDDLLISSY
jgi:hypothetical protein